MLQVARISTNPSTDWVSNSFDQLILETCVMKIALNYMYWDGRAGVSTWNNPLQVKQ